MIKYICLFISGGIVTYIVSKIKVETQEDDIGPLFLLAVIFLFFYLL